MAGMCEHGTHRIPDCPSCGMVKSKCWADSDSNSAPPPATLTSHVILKKLVNFTVPQGPHP